MFHSGMYEYDRALALAPLQDAARIYRMGDKVTGLRLALRDPLAAPRVVRELAQQIGGGFYISDWTRNHASFFRSIQVSKSMMFMILLLVVAVAAFNIVATLVMVVKEKRPAIAILRTLGALPRNVLAIFTVQGALIGLTGTAVGALLGWFISAHVAALVAAIERSERRAVPRCARVLHERTARLRGVARRAAGVRAWHSCCARWPRSIRRGAPRCTQPAEALRHD